MEALIAAYDKYSDMVYRLALARTGNIHDAEDLLQEVFMRFMRSGKQPSDDEHLKALLIKITINCSKSKLTSAWRKNTQPLDDTLACEEKDLETLDAVLRLPQKYRTVIHLHYYCGYSVEELSKILNASPSAIKTRLFRARDALKKDLKGVEF